MFQPTKEWVNKVNLSSFELKHFFKFVLVRLVREKPNHLTPQPCLHTLMQTLLLANQSERTISEPVGNIFLLFKARKTLNYTCISYNVFKKRPFYSCWLSPDGSDAELFVSLSYFELWPT